MEGKEETMEYLFVYSEGGWWLKIDSIEKLTDYHKKVDSNKFEDAFRMYADGVKIEELPLEERIKKMQERNYKYLQAAVMQAQKVEGTILDGFRCLNMEIGMSELRCIKENGAIYLNRAGGHTFALEYTQFCRRKELVFPDFKLSDIRIKQFQGGKHWYAFIGDMQVRNGEQLKWDTFQEAEQAANRIVAGI